MEITKPVRAMFDCGFSGQVCIPLKLAVALELKLKSLQSYELADGRIIENEPVYQGKILWDDTWFDMDILTTQSIDPLVGVSFFARTKSIITLDFLTKDFRIDQ